MEPQPLALFLSELATKERVRDLKFQETRLRHELIQALQLAYRLVTFGGNLSELAFDLERPNLRLPDLASGDLIQQRSDRAPESQQGE